MANIINVAGAGREFSYNQSYQKSQSDVLSNPNQYGLYTADQYQAKLNEYNRGVTDGRQDVIDHPNNYNLYTESQVNSHDIPRKIRFEWWYSTRFDASDPNYGDAQGYAEDEKYTLQIYVNESLVNEFLYKDGKALYNMTYFENGNEYNTLFGYVDRKFVV